MLNSSFLFVYELTNILLRILLQSWTIKINATKNFLHCQSLEFLCMIDDRTLIGFVVSVYGHQCVYGTITD